MEIDTKDSLGVRDKDIRRFWSKVIKRRKNQCWFWEKHHLNGDLDKYGQIRIGGKKMLAPRFSYLITHGELPRYNPREKTCVCHSCDRPACVNPEHLFIGTHKENMVDAQRKKRMGTPSGENNWNSKLTWEDIAFIRSCELTGRELARKFNKKESQISRIRRHKAWRTECLPENKGHLIDKVSIKKSRWFVCKGQNNPMSKLERKEVEAIRLLKIKGVKLREIASMFSVSESTIENIVSKRTWQV